ncbi:MAG: LytTR family transcriptional regulator [Devosiaceae bacterium]|nr:LytTR family transcriptional regulator [Devosiaceae bacterium]
MKTSALQLTLRETQAQISSKKTWAIIGMVTLILGFSGPFQTYSLLAFGPRLAYWAVMGVASFWVGSFFGTWAFYASKNWKTIYAIQFVAIGFAAGIPVAIVVIILNQVALNYGFNDPKAMLTLAAYCIGIAMAITGVFHFYKESATKKAPEPAKVLLRIPVEKRGKLISMSVQDHYVEIVTSRGTHLALVRLSDAISETEGTKGFQIHRSHWVAENAIKSIQRKNGKVFLVAENLLELPVSRTYVKVLKESGLLT